MTSGIPLGPIRTLYLPARNVPAFWRQWRNSVFPSQRRIEAWIVFSKTLAVLGRAWTPSRGPFLGSLFLKAPVLPSMRNPG